MCKLLSSTEFHFPGTNSSPNRDIFPEAILSLGTEAIFQGNGLKSQNIGKGRK